MTYPPGFCNVSQGYSNGRRSTSHVRVRRQATTTQAPALASRKHQTCRCQQRSVPAKQSCKCVTPPTRKRASTTTSTITTPYIGEMCRKQLDQKLRTQRGHVVKSLVRCQQHQSPSTHTNMKLNILRLVKTCALGIQRHDEKILQTECPNCEAM